MNSSAWSPADELLFNLDLKVFDPDLNYSGCRFRVLVLVFSSFSSGDSSRFTSKIALFSHFIVRLIRFDPGSKLQHFFHF